MIEKIGIPLLAFLIGLAIPAFKIVGMADVIFDQSTTITTLSGENAKLTTSNERLVRSLEAQTVKVTEWEDQAKKRKEAADAALAAATKEAAKWQQKYQRLLTDPPADPSNQGASLEKRMAEYIDARADK